MVFAVSQQSQSLSLLEYATLRAVELMNVTYSMKFDGTAAEYPRFITYWDERFGSSSFTHAEKLSHLILSTTGKAHRCVAPYEGTVNWYTVNWYTGKWLSVSLNVYLVDLTS